MCQLVNENPVTPFIRLEPPLAQSLLLLSPDQSVPALLNRIPLSSPVPTNPAQWAVVVGRVTHTNDCTVVLLLVNICWLMLVKVSEGLKFMVLPAYVIVPVPLVKVSLLAFVEPSFQVPLLVYCGDTSALNQKASGYIEVPVTDTFWVVDPAAAFVTLPVKD